MSVKRGMTVPVFPHQFAWEMSLIPSGGKKFCSCEPTWTSVANQQYWWRNTTQIWVVLLLLIGWSKFPSRNDESETLPRSGSDGIPALASQTTFCRKPVVASRNVGCFLGYSYGKIWCMGLLEIRSVLVPFLQLNNYSHLVYCLFKLRVNSQTSLVLCYSMCGFRKQTETLKHLMRHVIGRRKYTTRSLS